MNQSSGNSKVLVLVLVIGGGGVLLACCGLVGFVVYWFSTFDEEFARQVRVEVADNPVILEHIGEIQSFTHDGDASVDEPGDIYVFLISGSKGSGTLRAECITIDADHEDVPSGELIMASGEVYQLFPENPLDDSEFTGFGEFEDEFARQVKVDIENNAVILQHIGQITDISYDDDRSMDEPGEFVYVFHLSGDKGNGTLRAECITISEDEEDVPSGELIMSTGEIYQLYPNNPLLD